MQAAHRPRRARPAELIICNDPNMRACTDLRQSVFLSTKVSLRKSPHIHMYTIDTRSHACGKKHFTVHALHIQCITLQPYILFFSHGDGQELMLTKQEQEPAF